MNERSEAKQSLTRKGKEGKREGTKEGRCETAAKIHGRGMDKLAYPLTLAPPPRRRHRHRFAQSTFGGGGGDKRPSLFYEEEERLLPSFHSLAPRLAPLLPPISALPSFRRIKLVESDETILILLCGSVSDRPRPLRGKSLREF